MYSLQTEVVIENRTFHITNNGDFRMVLDCFSALSDEEMSEDSRVLASLLIFYNELNSIQDVFACGNIVDKLVKEMYKFFNCGQTENIGKRVERKTVDWTTDSQMICSAVNNIANCEIRSLNYLHWWTFMGYYMSIGRSTFSTVVGIRHKLLNGKKLEKWEQEFKRDNPNYFVWKSSTVQDKDAEALVRDLWNKGGDT